MIRSILATGLLLSTSLWSFAPSDDVHWPSFRGNDASGIAQGYPVPTEWDVPSGRNLAWKIPIPGLAHSSPVIWGDQVFLTTAVTDGQDNDELKVGLYGAIEPVDESKPVDFRLLAINKQDGRILWQKSAFHGVPEIKRHPKSTHANSTPATDGTHLVVFFGSEGLYCYDMEGNLLWKKDLGVLDSGFFRVPEAQWGFASSPVIHEGRVIVQVDVQKDSFLASFDVKTGKEIWRTARKDVPTWSTPTVHSEGGRSQIIVNGYKHIGGYDFDTGKELWKLAGGGDIPVPTPIVEQGLIFITNAHGSMAPIYAIKTGASGQLEASQEGSSAAIAWSELGRRGAYMPTPIVMDGYLYICRDNGVLAAYRAASGEEVYRERLGQGGAYSASGVAADGKLFFPSEDGDVHVVKAGPDFELLATNSLDEVTMASPAISEGMLFFRTQRHLIAIGQ